MTERHSYEFIKEQFEGVGYTLISTEYKGAHSKLEYVCDKGHTGLMTYASIRCGYKCNTCSAISAGKSRRHSYEFIKSEFKKRNYTLTSTEYVGAHLNLDYICDRGHKSTISWNSLSKNQGCYQCSIDSKSGKNNPAWRGGVIKLNIPLYDTYAYQIDFCEETRRGPDNSDFLQVKCTECREWFSPNLVQVKGRIWALTGPKNGENRFYCSDNCKNSCSIYGKHKYPEGFKVDRSREVQPDLKELCLIRDNNECQRCGSKEDLICHHYEGIEQNPIESADTDSCVILCKDCHLKAHEDVGCRYVDLTKKVLCS